ncbi:MAG: Lrp/AsnC ligand binding domain-containing protein [Candidatus Heimdallarchaeum aukensis]|uniref:Lrp/AsnC ligand binding domain-containing protein n=1 Tax=Candidatus Heimdallarchaeum aukensis TaxID=2876573 RepID=A0A9Y1BLD6_9ARCH|nr:MAG: Lrp/AsnC ligand binding domain-containing protein [Candidatus Heimdallarchaeum aukensis]
MIITAYILMTVKLGKTQEVVNELRKIHAITSCAVVTGEWDIVATIKVKDLEELYNITSECIHLIPGLESTQTCIVEKEIIGEE